MMNAYGDSLRSSASDTSILCRPSGHTHSLGKLTWCLTSTETVRLIRDGEKRGGGYGGGGRGILYTQLPHCHHRNDFCIKMGSDECHFNVSLIVRDKVTGQCPQTTFPKRRESRNGIEPRPFCLPTVTGQTGSQIKCGSNPSRYYAPTSRPTGKLFGCHYCGNSLPKKSENTTTKETPHYNIAKLNQPRFMAQVKAVVN